MFYRGHVEAVERESKQEFKNEAERTMYMEKIARDARIAIETDLYLMPLLLVFMCQCFTHILIGDVLHLLIMVIMWCIGLMGVIAMEPDVAIDAIKRICLRGFTS